jgi:alkylhydroperoxidase family enzyme
VRRLTGDEHLSPEFATTWRTYDLDEGTRTLLDYAEKLTKAPATVDDGDVEALRRAGWGEQGIYEATALASFFNFTGRLEAASGLPPDEVPAGGRWPEASAEASASRRS